MNEKLENPSQSRRLRLKIKRGWDDMKKKSLKRHKIFSFHSKRINSHWNFNIHIRGIKIHDEETKNTHVLILSSKNPSKMLCLRKKLSLFWGRRRRNMFCAWKDLEAVQRVVKMAKWVMCCGCGLRYTYETAKILKLKQFKNYKKFINLQSRAWEMKIWGK